MTKDELKKKLEKKAEKECVLNDRIHIDCFVSGYLKGALPREKRIAELEKENAELKSKNKWYSEQVCNKECAEVWGQLTKAIELLKWALHSDPEHDNLADFDTKWKEAEQFIKEIEK